MKRRETEETANYLPNQLVQLVDRTVIKKDRKNKTYLRRDTKTGSRGET